jgi:hypothetical protein
MVICQGIGDELSGRMPLAYAHIGKFSLSTVCFFQFYFSSACLLANSLFLMLAPPIVQVLVDTILWLYPFMAISSNMSGLLTILGTGILTASYQGLFQLAKQFLDPYDK